MQTIDYRRGLPAMAACFLIWGFQPLYWYMCTNVCGEIDTFFLMACRIIWAAVTCLCILKVQGKLPQLWAAFRDKQVMKREIPMLGGPSAADITPSLMVVMPHFTQFVQELEDGLSEKYGWYPTATWHYAFDTDLPENQQADMDGTTPNLKDALDDYLSGVSSDWGVGVSVESKAGNRADFYGTYGGLFFLGIMLSIVFIFAAVAILYYKQLSEGYEDQSRFDIMQKVGMTKGDIRRSINSQLLTVFYLPLLMAGLHLCFAFPFIHKLLMLFNLDNRGLLVGTTAVSFAVFAALYALVYKLTGNAYYHIVADNKE